MPESKGRAEKRWKAVMSTLKKEEFLKVNGFAEDPESMSWINRTHKVWMSY